MDFAPFRALIDLPLAMTAHVIYSAIDPARPATQSGDVIEAIRDDIGFKGLLMTDDLSMKALTGSFADRATTSLGAGCDLILHCNGDMSEMHPIAEAAGRLDGRRDALSEAALALRSRIDPLDEASLLEELAAEIMLPGDAGWNTPSGR